MKIDWIEIYGLKRLMAVSRIKLFKAEYSEIIQLILGANGMGKSALIHQLTPLPATKEDYIKEGYKIIGLSKDQDKYVLRSTMNPNPRHSFIKNEVELNKDGLQSTQKKLVEDEFGITPEIHALLTGEVRFTAMAFPERRKWFTMISDVPYDYALSVYKELQSRVRGLSEANKLSKKRLTIEVTKIISKDEQDRLKQEIEALHLEMDHLQRERAPLLQPEDHYTSLKTRKTLLLNSMIDNVLRIRRVIFGQINHESMEMLDADIDENKQNLATNQALLNRELQEYERLQKQKDIFAKAGTQGLASIKENIEKAEKERNALSARRHLQIAEIDPKLGLETLYSVREVLDEVLATIPNNSERQFSQATYKADTEKYQELHQRQDRELKRQKLIQDEFARMERHKTQEQTQCPKCSFKWVLGFSDERYEQLKEQLITMGYVIEELHKEMTIVKTRMDSFEEYRNLYLRYTQCVKTTPVLMPFWEYVAEHELILNAPRTVQTLIENLESDLKITIDMWEIDRSIKENHNTAERLASADLEGFKDIDANMQKTRESIETLTRSVVEKGDEVKRLTTLKRNMVEYLDLGNKLRLTADEIESLTSEHVESIRREVIHETIRQLQVSLSNKTRILSEIELQKRVIAELEGNIEEMTIQEEAATKLMVSLSPTDGLIAEGLLSSIRAACADMTHFIEKAWSYPIQILPCATESEGSAELDYRFPMVLMDNDPITDVKMGSRGQREIIDLAFLFMVLRRVGVHVPLFLDEFGSGLDEEHRRRASHLIQSLAEMHVFPQIFMVSHYEAAYGSLTQCEITVLSEDNIAIPTDKNYNQHVSIDY